MSVPLAIPSSGSGKLPVEAWVLSATALIFSVACGATVVTLFLLFARISQHGFLGDGGDSSAPSAAVIDATRAAAEQNPLAPPGPPPPGIDATSPAVNLVLGGLFMGLFTSGVVAWLSLAPLGHNYRRGAFSLVAAMGTMLPMLVAAGLDRAFQQYGLLALIGVGIAVAARYRSRLQRMVIVAP